MSFINEEEETYEFLNSKTLNGSFINDDDNNNKYNDYYNKKELEELFIKTFPDVDYKSLIKQNDYLDQDTFLYEKNKKIKYKYILNKGWEKFYYYN
jgi:hypothetical protein